MKIKKGAGLEWRWAVVWCVVVCGVVWLKILKKDESIQYWYSSSSIISEIKIFLTLTCLTFDLFVLAGVLVLAAFVAGRHRETRP